MAGVNVDLIKVVARGTIDGVQTWSTSFWFAVGLVGAAPSAAQMTALAGACDAELSTWYSALEHFAAADTKRVDTALYYYPANSIHSTVAGESATAGTDSGTGGQYMPTSVSIVASMKTGITGASARGRSYFPATALTVTSNHQISGGDCNTIATAYAHVLAELALAIVAGSSPISEADPVVASFKQGGTHAIIQVEVDSRPDTQRRRVDKLPAVTSATVAVGV